MEPKEIAQAACAALMRNITDEIFLIIQRDRELMQSYLQAVHKYGPDVVNRKIGQVVKEEFSLENAPEREDNPTCTLIKSHQIFA